MTDNVVEDRLDVLTREITSLKNRLDDLTERFEALEAGSPATAGATAPATQSDEDEYTPFPEIDTDKVFSWVGTSSLLPRIATICFILVFALVLRTFTDNGIIGKQLGSFIGMGYAAVLIGWGGRLLAKKSRLASVFFVSGILLMYTIAWETHVRFESVSSFSVFIILTILLAVSSLLSTRFNHSGMNGLALLGTSFLAMIIDLPNPAFIPLILFFLVANLISFVSAKKLGRGEWNRLIVFFLTVCVMLLWIFKLQIAFTSDNVLLTPELAAQWYLPAILLFFTLFFSMSLVWFLRKGEASLFDILLPSINAFWAYSLAYLFIDAAGGASPYHLGYVGIGIGLIHFGIALYFYMKEVTGGAGICSFAVSGSFFLIMAFPPSVGGILPAIPVWVVLAFAMFRVSDTCEIGGLRLTSYLLPALACILGIASGGFAVNSAHPFIAIAVSGILSVVSGIQYFLCRRSPISCHAGYFAVVDRLDRSGVILLTVSLISGFCMLQIAAYQFLAGLEGDSANVLKGVQSLLINAGAIGLLFMAIRNRNKEILTVAVVVIVIGALKVFGHDLFRSYGVPLVLSVLSFGVVAATGSMVMSRWSQKSRPEYS